MKQTDNEPISFEAAFGIGKETGKAEGSAPRLSISLEAEAQQLSHYPTSLVAAFVAFATRRDEEQKVVLCFETEQAATNLRIRLYTIQRYILRNALDFPLLAPSTRKLKFAVQGATVVFHEAAKKNWEVPLSVSVEGGE